MMSIARMQIVACLTVLFALVFGPIGVSAAQTPSTPSAQVLLNSWQAWTQNVGAKLHSYQLNASSSCVETHSENQWQAIVDGEQYRWSYENPIVNPQAATETSGILAVNQLGWSCLTFKTGAKPPDESYLGIKYTHSFTRLQAGLHWFYAQNDPYNLCDFARYPQIQWSPFPLEKQLPLISYFQREMAHLTVRVVKPHGVSKSLTYRLTMPQRFIPSHLALPSVVDFKVLDGTFIPVRYVVTVGTLKKMGSMRLRLHVTRGGMFAGVWFPTQFVADSDFVSYYPSRPQARFWSETFRGKMNLLITKVNQPFPESDFTIKFPPGTHVTINDVSEVIPLNHVQPKWKVFVVKALLAIIAFVVIGITVIALRRARSRGSYAH
jgi:hypothetical protein